MKRLSSNNTYTNAIDLWLLVSRVAVGIFMLTHGFPKLQTLLSGDIKFADPFGFGATPSLILTVFAEFFCSVLLIIGFATRLATIPLIITMLVAIFSILSDQPFEKKELPSLYLLIFIGFFIWGAGRYSVDYLIGGKNKRR